MPAADHAGGVPIRRRSLNTPLSPSEFFQPSSNPSRLKKFKKALMNWLNGIPVQRDEDVLRGIESEQALTQPSSPTRTKTRRRDWLKGKLQKLSRSKTEDKSETLPAAEFLKEGNDLIVEEIEDDDDSLKKEKKKGKEEDRAPIRIIQVPPPHIHHHLFWHLEHGYTTKKDDLNSYSVSNRIKTAKYSLLTFLPKNLFEQFRRVANVYFLFIVILQAIPVISNYNVGLAAMPLIVIVGITAAKDAFEDYKRFKQDQTVNFSHCRALKHPDIIPVIDENSRESRFRRLLKKVGLIKDPQQISHLPTEKIDWQQKYWQDVRVGDVIYLSNNEMIPADIVILSTSEPDSACYVETKNLDGETNLKVKKGPVETAWVQTAEDASEFKGQLEVELPSSNLYSFFGRLILPNIQQTGLSKKKMAVESADEDEDEFIDVEPTVVPINTNSLLLRGCVLRNTNYVIGVVVYTGNHTKLIMNAGGTPSKRSRIERQMNPQVLFALLI